MNQQLLITSLGAVFTITVLLAGSLAPVMAGISGPAPDCGGKPTISGTSGDDNTGFITNTSEVYNMKGGNDNIDDEDNPPKSDVARLGGGNDFVAMRGGNDTVCLGDGDDEAHTDDGVVDLIKCGDGNDTVFVDGFDILEECENVIISGVP